MTATVVTTDYCIDVRPTFVLRREGAQTTPARKINDIALHNRYVILWKIEDT
jgi:hypothetical protein